LINNNKIKGRETGGEGGREGKGEKKGKRDHIPAIYILGNSASCGVVVSTVHIERGVLVVPDSCLQVGHNLTRGKRLLLHSLSFLSR
jgi:hypothetical protein